MTAIAVHPDGADKGQAFYPLVGEIERTFLRTIGVTLPQLLESRVPLKVISSVGNRYSEAWEAATSSLVVKIPFLFIDTKAIRPKLHIS